MANELKSLNDSPAFDEPLSLPHFDEEATLQSARRVVPLHEVKARGRFRRRWLLGGALALAATLGAATASLIYSPGSQPEEASVVDTNADSTPAAGDFVSPSGEASGSSVNPSDAAISEPEPEKVATASETNETSNSAVRVRKQVPQNSVRRQSDRAAVSPIVDQVREDEILAEEMELRREQRREARRLRRERRVTERNSGEGLTRIREIFEGSPRP